MFDSLVQYGTMSGWLEELMHKRGVNAQGRLWSSLRMANYDAQKVETDVIFVLQSLQSK